jgi:lysophospholipase L1-like esterase
MDPKDLAFKCMENPFLIGNDNAIFHVHSRLGFIVNNGEFVGENRFVKREETIEQLKKLPKHMPVIINMGDSSTSGWHSDYLSRDEKNTPTSPYFHYKTYSDLMRERFPGVVNAGVSKYTSFQGAIYLAEVLRDFAKKGIPPDYVTLYFGNNDSVYSTIEDKTSIDGMLPTSEKTSQRVTIQDFEYNFLRMIELIRNYGARPVIIVPCRRYGWPPGLRSQRHVEEYNQGLQQLNPEELKRILINARRLFSDGRLEKALETDIFLPRIKKQYVKIFKGVARRQSIDLIDIQGEIIRDSDFFCDYCHPIEPANRIIANKFIKILDKSPRPTSKWFDYLFRKDSPPEDIYPIF